MPAKIQRWSGGFFSKKNTLAVNTPVSCALAQLHQRFLKSHQTASSKALESIQTVMVLKSGILSLWRNDKEMKQVEAKEISPPLYHVAKQVCHVPIILLNTLNAPDVSSKTWIDMEKMLINSLQELPYSATLSNHRHMTLLLEKSIACVKQLSHCKHWSSHDKEINHILTLYQKTIDPHIQHLSATATELQLAALHELIQLWIAIHAIDLHSNRVLLVAPHGPRKGYIEMQYIIELYKRELGLSEPIKDKYVYYVEMLGSQMNTVDIKSCLIEEFLAREEQNKIAAARILGNPLGMQQDILKDHAPTIIEKLFVKNTLLSRYSKG